MPSRPSDWRPGAVVVIALSAFALACGSNSGGSSAGGGAPASSSSAAAGPSTVPVGTPMKASDGKSVTVTSFKLNYLSDNEFERPSAGKECVQVNFSLVNGSSSEWSLPTFELKVVDNNGQKYDTGTCGNSDNVSSLVAGGTAKASEYYEVPAGGTFDANWVPNQFESEVFQTPLK